MTGAMVDVMRQYEGTRTKPWDARIALRDLAYQAGGLLKLDMQLHGERHCQGKSQEKLRQEMEVELAEVVAVALFAAHELGLDIGRGFDAMLDKDKEKIIERSTDA